MNKTELKEFLDFKSVQYNCISFIESDPIQIPHFFTKKEDIEISGFLTAIISWGNRKSIQKSAINFMERMDNKPFEFVFHASEKELVQLKSFYYRTFQDDDPVFFIKALKYIYIHHGGLEAIFEDGYRKTDNLFDTIEYVKTIFLNVEHKHRNIKHLPSPARGSAAKRIHMFLRWMCRQDNNGVDFGIWKTISPAHLICPLDLHSGNVARKLGLLHRKQNDRKAAEELTLTLREFESVDPVKYDYALFGLGVFEKF